MRAAHDTHPNAIALRNAHSSFAEREASANASVTEWRFGHAPRVSLLPLHDERTHPHSRSGRVLAGATEPRDGVVEYGHDAEGRLRVVRSYAMRGQKGLLHELMLVDHEPDAIRWSVHHESAGRAVLEVGLLRIESGAPIDAHIVTTNASIVERYDRDEGGHVVAIGVRTEQQWSHAKRARVTSTRFIVERGALGEVVRVEVEDGDSRVTTYQLPRAGGRAASAQALVSAIVKATLRLCVRPADAEPAFALAISWSPNALLPPLVSLGLASDRTRSGTSAPLSVWAPTEWATTLEVHRDPEVSAACAELYAACPSPDDEPFIVEVLRRAAAMLRSHDVSTLLPVTSDFVVIALDWLQEDLDRALRDART